MAALIGGGLAILTLCILIGIFIYDKRVKNDRNTVLETLWKLAIDFTHADSEIPYATVVDIPISKLSIMTVTEMAPKDFGLAIQKLVKEKYIKNNINTIQFTEHGAKYYEFILEKKINSQ